MRPVGRDGDTDQVSGVVPPEPVTGVNEVAAVLRVSTFRAPRGRLEQVVTADHQLRQRRQAFEDLVEFGGQVDVFAGVAIACGGDQHLGFDLAEASGAPLMAWKRLDVDIDNADLINRRFAVKRVLLDGMEPYVAVNRDGEMNWLRLVEGITAGAGGEVKEPAAKAPEWNVGEIRLTNGNMHWQDESTVRPTAGNALDINVDFHDRRTLSFDLLNGSVGMRSANSLLALPAIRRWSRRPPPIAPASPACRTARACSRSWPTDAHGRSGTPKGA